MGGGSLISTYTQIYYHIVYSTKDRERSLKTESREDLFRYIWGILQNKECHLYRIGGVEDHIHILTSLHPTISLANLIKELKVSSSIWVKENGVFPQFTGWQDGYGAFTYSENERDDIIEYIKNQQEHHKKESFQDELRKLLIATKIKFDEKFLV